MGLTRIRAEQISDIDYKQAVRVITLTDITLSGGAPAVVDNISLVAGDRVLVAGQDPASENGLYYVSVVGAGSNGTWLRSLDGNETGEIQAGMIVMVTEGDIYKDTQWKLTTDDPIVIGVSPLTFEQNSAYAFGNIYANGTAVLATTVGDTLTLTAGNNISITGNATTKTVDIAVVGISLSSIANGTSNVNIASSNANITISVNGTPNVAVFSDAGANISGYTTVTGNITGGNLITGGLASVTGNITGGNLTTTGTANIGTLAVTGNANVGNLGTAGLIVATGNINGTGAVFSGNVTASNFIGNISGNIDAGGANTNIQFNDGDILAGSAAFTFDKTSNAVTASGNITGGNLNTAGQVVVTGNITGGNVTTAGTANIGTLEVTGNANVGNLNTAGVITATGNITGGNIVTSGQASVIGNVTGGNLTTAGQVVATGNVTGGNVTTAGTANIGTLSVTGTANVTGNANVGNLETNGVIVATANITGGNLITGGLTSTNTLDVTANANVGNLGTGGLITATGNVTGGNVNTAGQVIATGNVTGGNLTTGGLTSTDILSVTGNANVGNLNTAGQVVATGNVTGGNLTTGGTANIGTLEVTGTANVTGNASVGNLNTAGVITATGNITGGNLVTSNLVSAGTLNTVGDTTIGGNLYVQGNITYINISDLQVEDPVIILGTGPNGAPLTVNDNKDRGIFMEYYTTEIGNAFMGWDNSTGNMFIASNVSIANDVISVNSYGNFVTGHGFFENIEISDNLSAGNIGATGNIAGENVIADNLLQGNIGQIFGNLDVGNLGSGGNFTTTGNVNSNNLVTTGLASIGTTLSVTGNANVGNLDTGGLITATGNITGGNVTTAGQVTATENITGGNVTTDGQVTATGNITGGNVITAGNVTGNYILGNGSQLSGINTFSTIAVAGANSVVANSIADTLTLVAGLGVGITTDDTNDTITITADTGSGQSIFATGGDTGLVAQAPTVVEDFGLISDSVTESFGLGDPYINDGLINNVNIVEYSIYGNRIANNTITNQQLASDIVLSTTGNITGGNLITSGTASVTGNVTAGNVITNTVYSNSTGNINFVGNLIPAANVYTLGSAVDPWADAFFGPQSITILDESGNIGNSVIIQNITANIVIGTTGFTINEFGTSNSVFRIEALTGQIFSAANTIIENTTQSSNVASGSLQTAGGAGIAKDLYVGGNINTTGNIAATYFKGDGSLLTGIAPTVQIYEFANTASGVSTYLTAQWLADFTPGPKANITVTVSTANTLIQSFITESGYPNITVLPVGTIAITCETKKASGNRTYTCYAEIYRRTTGGTETLLATTESSQSTVNTVVQQTLPAYIAVPVTFNDTDRIVTKIYARTSQGNDNITLSFDNNTNSGIQLPALPASAAQFVPYNNPTANVNLGSYGLSGTFVSATGNITGGNVTTTGAVYSNFNTNIANTASFNATGGNTKGGTGYLDFLVAQNTSGGATNPYKWLRVNSTGGLEIINSAYNSLLLSLTDAGALSIASSISIAGKKAVNGPAFRASIAVGQTITSGTQQKVTFGTETFDTDDNFASSRFTPTTEGYYQLNATVRIAGGSSTGEYMLVIWKNGAEYSRGSNGSGTEIGSNFYSLQVSDIAYANGTGDYFEIYIQQTSGSNKDTTAGAQISYFSGVMVRGA
jgi:hypothetical protein